MAQVLTRIPPEQARPMPVEQARRGRTSINSGWGERVADVVVGSGLIYAGLRQRSLLGGVLALSGGWFLYAGATGRFQPYAALGLVREEGRSGKGLIVERSITIGKPRRDVYPYWRNFSHLPSFMEHLENVTPIDDYRSHWVARAPLNRKVEWDAEIIDERPNELIAWQSLPGASVTHRGDVRFADAPGGRGTEITVHLIYQPPLGTAGAALARLFTEEPGQQIGEDLRRLKAVLETGEYPTTRNQPRGRIVLGIGRQHTDTSAVAKEAR